MPRRLRSTAPKGRTVATPWPTGKGSIRSIQPFTASSLAEARAARMAPVDLRAMAGPCGAGRFPSFERPREPSARAMGTRVALVTQKWTYTPSTSADISHSAGTGCQATGSCAAPHSSKGAASPVSSLTLEISMARFLLRRLPEPSMGPSPRLVRPAVSALAFSAARESSLASSGRDQPSSAVGVRTAAGAGPGTGCPAAPSLGSSLVEKTTAIGPLQRAVWLRVRSGGSSWWSVQMPLEVPLIMPAPLATSLDRMRSLSTGMRTPSVWQAAQKCE
mmetsp:Transcript_8653/g.25285  ORF Transcript_8653/g.25285 Transcript_8653/m.25285 type:complete len:276 (-) Transcript_8653:324-1151(-)